MQAEAKEFVRVKDGEFVVGRQDLRFRFVGANSFLLLERACNMNTRHIVDEILDTAKLAGLSVLRMWAFFDGHKPGALQRSPGTLSEDGAHGLDYVIHAARMRGLRLLPCLTNYWPEYGGLGQYVRWADGKNSATSDEFYGNHKAMEYLMTYATAIVNRMNTMTGVRYRDDPTIFGWDAVNEPRYPKGKDSKAVQEFLASFMQLLRREAPNQLLTIGVDGFCGTSMSNDVCGLQCPYDIPGDVAHACADMSIPGIDFASFHLWLDNWGIKDKREEFVTKWIKTHSAAARNKLRVPIVLTEFNSMTNQLEHLEQVFGHVLGTGDTPGDLSGAMFFHLTADDYSCTDKNRIFTSKEIRRRLQVIEENKGTDKNQTKSQASSREDECWEVLLLCYKTAQKIPPV